MTTSGATSAIMVKAGEVARSAAVRSHSISNISNMKLTILVIMVRVANNKLIKIATLLEVEETKLAVITKK